MVSSSPLQVLIGQAKGEVEAVMSMGVVVLRIHGCCSKWIPAFDLQRFTRS